ncbi:MAG: HNH endonuclease [Alphaproteobacteria bacterium]|nr:MAG: hypothetical protein B6I23_01795 [Rickettsiaceae bacterium 4572_127]
MKIFRNYFIDAFQDKDIMTPERLRVLLTLKLKKEASVNELATACRYESFNACCSVLGQIGNAIAKKYPRLFFQKTGYWLICEGYYRKNNQNKKEYVWVLRKKVIKALDFLYPSEKEIKKIINAEKNYRTPKLYDAVKKLENNTCQICAEKIKLEDGKLYSEAHHIKPKKNRGLDIAENLIIVCPNCHKKLDRLLMKIDINKLKHNNHEISDEYVKYHNDKVKKGKKE